jgi:hypothetical protein
VDSGQIDLTGCQNWSREGCTLKLAGRSRSGKKNPTRGTFGRGSQNAGILEGNDTVRRNATNSSNSHKLNPVHIISEYEHAQLSALLPRFFEFGESGLMLFI